MVRRPGCRGQAGRPVRPRLAVPASGTGRSHDRTRARARAAVCQLL